MKFPQLPLGQRFVFQGDVYAKIGPMSARRERDGQPRLIPRSAVLAPPESLQAPDPAAGHWSAALDAYERELRAVLRIEDAELADRLDSALRQGRTAFAVAMSETTRGKDPQSAGKPAVPGRRQSV